MCKIILTYIFFFKYYIIIIFIIGDLTGIISERDYISKIALLGRTSKDTMVKEIATQSSKLVTVKPEDTVQACMEKMLASDIRHLPLVDNGELKGMLSIKDLVKTTIKEKEDAIKVLSDFALGKGGHFGSE
ncbi:MAG: signal-transduction protein with cAMP-binding, CBS, and nucleotidyltransferase domain [Bacillariaceae sp.]